MALVMRGSAKRPSRRGRTTWTSGRLGAWARRRQDPSQVDHSDPELADPVLDRPKYVMEAVLRISPAWWTVEPRFWMPDW